MMTPRYFEYARKWRNALPSVSTENEFLEGIAWLVEEAVAQERERCAKIADPPLMHRKGPPGLWRKRRAKIAAAIRDSGYVRL